MRAIGVSGPIANAGGFKSTRSAASDQNTVSFEVAVRCRGDLPHRGRLRGGWSVGASHHPASCRVQRAPSHRSMSGRPPAGIAVTPTAVQAVGGVHETPSNEPRTDGPFWVAHVAPSQRAMSGRACALRTG